MSNPEQEAKEAKKKLKKTVSEWKEKNPGWEESQTIQYLKGKIKPSTWAGYRSSLPVFFAWLEVDDPDTLIGQRIDQLKNEDVKIKFHFEDRLTEFRDFLTSIHYQGSTVKMMCARVAGFFSNNRYDLNVDNDFWDKASQGSKIAESLRSSKEYPDLDEVRAVIDLADNKMATAILIGYQNGLVNVDVADLSWENFGSPDFETETREFIGFEGRRSKTGQKFTGVLNPDILEVLRPYWIECGKPRTGFVFEGYKNSPMEAQTLNRAFKQITKKALPPDRGEALSFKSLRDAYHSKLVDANIEGEIKDSLFGHKRPGSKDHYSVSHVVEIYKEKIFPLVSINGWRLRGRASKVEELEAEVRTLRSEVEDLKYFKQRLENIEEMLSRNDELVTNPDLDYSEEATEERKKWRIIKQK